jgi:hypothetical protein
VCSQPLSFIGHKLILQRLSRLDSSPDPEDLKFGTPELVNVFALLEDSVKIVPITVAYNFNLDLTSTRLHNRKSVKE